jgi:ketosteroid isomerase-like protein
MKQFIFQLLVLIFLSSCGQEKGLPDTTDAKSEILEALQIQQQAWNNGNIKEFMSYYWNSDSLIFLGKSGLNRGWEKTYNNYLKAYPDSESMGKLKFEVLHYKRLNNNYCYLIGSWHLSRNDSLGDLSGHFDLLWQNMNGSWYIISDHSS